MGDCRTDRIDWPNIPILSRTLVLSWIAPTITRKMPKPNCPPTSNFPRECILWTSWPQTHAHTQNSTFTTSLRCIILHAYESNTASSHCACNSVNVWRVAAVDRRTVHCGVIPVRFRYRWWWLTTHGIWHTSHAHSVAQPKPITTTDTTTGCPVNLRARKHTDANTSGAQLQCQHVAMNCETCPHCVKLVRFFAGCTVQCSGTLCSPMGVFQLGSVDNRSAISREIPRRTGEDSLMCFTSSVCCAFFFEHHFEFFYEFFYESVLTQWFPWNLKC